MSTPTVRKQGPYVPLTKDQFRERFFARYQDPAFDRVQAELERICDVAWDGYIKYRKAPRTRPAGPGYADPTYKLSDDWRATRAAIDAAQARHVDPASPTRILLVNGSTRSEHTCPGEISKTSRLVQAARDAIAAQAGVEIDVLDPSTLADEPLKVIHPARRVSDGDAACHHRAAATRTTRWARRTTGWRSSIRAGSRRTAS
jgi:hypothetical protein